MSWTVWCIVGRIEPSPGGWLVFWLYVNDVNDVHCIQFIIHLFIWLGLWHQQHVIRTLVGIRGPARHSPDRALLSWPYGKLDGQVSHREAREPESFIRGADLLAVPHCGGEVGCCKDEL